MYTAKPKNSGHPDNVTQTQPQQYMPQPQQYMPQPQQYMPQQYTPQPQPQQYTPQQYMPQQQQSHVEPLVIEIADDVKVTMYPVLNKGATLAYMSMCVNDWLIIKNMALMWSQSKNSYFISWPSRKNSNGEYQNMAFCMDNEVNKLLTGRCMDVYRDWARSQSQC